MGTITETMQRLKSKTFANKIYSHCFIKYPSCTVKKTISFNKSQKSEIFLYLHANDFCFNSFAWHFFGDDYFHCKTTIKNQKILLVGLNFNWNSVRRIDISNKNVSVDSKMTDLSLWVWRCFSPVLATFIPTCAKTTGV